MLTAIQRIFKRKNKSPVLIPSKMGLPSMRICSVVLADTGTGDCPAQYTAAVPPVKKEEPKEEAKLKINGMEKKSDSNIFSTFSQDKINTKGESESIILKGISQDFKKSALSLNGSPIITFGKVFSSAGEFSATKVDFDPLKTEIIDILKIYSLSEKDGVVFCSVGQQDSLRFIIKELGLGLSVSVFNSFHS